MSHLVGNPEDRFSRVAAHYITTPVCFVFKKERRVEKRKIFATGRAMSGSYYIFVCQFISLNPV